MQLMLWWYSSKVKNCWIMQSDISMAYWVTGHEIVSLYSTQICFPCFVGVSCFMECGFYWNRVLSNKLEMDFTIRIDSTVRRDMNNASTLLKIQFQLIVPHLIVYKQHPLNSEIEVSRLFSTYSRRNSKHWVRHLVSRSKLDTGNIIQYKPLERMVLFFF